ncbi:MAG: diguanylate cyclase domain-containing protein [Novosphingobium sp.]
MAKVLPGQSTDQVIADRKAFDCTTPQGRMGAGDFVTEIRFAETAATNSQPLALRLPSVWQDSARIRFRYADGSEAFADFSSETARRFLTVGAIFEVEVPWRASPLRQIFIETRGSANLRGVVVGPELVTVEESHRMKLVLTAIYAAFAGLAGALLIYNLSLWFALRSDFLLDYCMMVISLTAYTFSSSGYLSMMTSAVANNDRLRLNYVLLACTGVFAVRFVRNFFGRDLFPPLLVSLSRATCWAALTSALLFAIFAPFQIKFLDKAYFVLLSSLLFAGIPMMFHALKEKAPYARMFLFAWSAPLVISLLRSAYGFGLVPYSILLDNSNLIAMSAESLLSAVMVTSRLRILATERDDAREGEINARRLAATDPLTGLLNRRAFLDMAIGRKAQQRLLLIDIDHFKAVNDRLGHEAGDRVLAAVAQAIQDVRPQRSLAVRLGGEEFALLMPRAHASQCPPEVLLKAVREAVMPQNLKVTVSIGYSEGQISSESDWKRLYRLADAALYRAKADGRDRACHATDFRSAA